MIFNKLYKFCSDQFQEFFKDIFLFSRGEQQAI